MFPSVWQSATAADASGYEDMLILQDPLSRKSVPVFACGRSGRFCAVGVDTSTDANEKNGPGLGLHIEKLGCPSHPGTTGG